MNLNKDVIESEFPNLKMQSPDGKKVVMTFKNGQTVVVGTEQTDGTYDSEVFEFTDVNDSVMFPDSPDFPDFLAKLSLDKFDGVANSNARDDYNNNVKHIQDTVNSLVDYSINQKGYFSKLKDAFSDIKSLILKHVDIVVAKYLHDNVETKYYSKVDVDKKVDFLQKQITNINHYIGDKPQPNSNFAKGFTGNPDYNDKIMDSNVEGKVENLNIEDEEGDSDGK